MTDQLVIEHLEFQGHCGVSEGERLIPQPIAVDLVLDYPRRGITDIAGTDEITRAVDYTKVAERAIEIGTSQSTSWKP